MDTDGNGQENTKTTRKPPKQTVKPPAQPDTHPDDRKGSKPANKTTVPAGSLPSTLTDMEVTRAEGLR